MPSAVLVEFKDPHNSIWDNAEPVHECQPDPWKA